MPSKKGIVLESNNVWSTVLLEGGQYIKVRGSLEVGAEYVQTPSKITHYSKYAAAAVLILMLLGTIDYFKVVAYANVSTGVEMGINRWSRVVAVNYSSNSELPTAKDLGLKGQKVENAVAMVVQAAAQTDNASPVQIEVISEGRNNRKLEKNIMEKVETSISSWHRDNHGKASYQRKGRIIEIENPEELVPSSSSVRKNQGLNNNKSNSSRPSTNKKDTADDNNNNNKELKPEQKAGQPKGQSKKDQEIKSQERPESVDQRKSVPANNKDKDYNNNPRKSKAGNLETEYRENNAKDKSHKDPAFSNNSDKADKNSGRPFTQPQN